MVAHALCRRRQEDAEFKVMFSWVRNVRPVWLQEDLSQNTKLKQKGMEWGGEEVSEAEDIAMEIYWRMGPDLHNPEVGQGLCLLASVKAQQHPTGLCT